MILHLIPILLITVLAFGFIHGGIIQEFDSTFGNLGKLPLLFKRWFHPENKKQELPTTAPQLPLEGEAVEREIMNVNKLLTDSQDYEELPKPMHLKNEIEGYKREDGTYVVEDTAGMPCIMAYFKATITVYYPTNFKQEQYDNRIVTPPDDVKVSGTCDRDSLIAVMDLSWPKGTFSLRFAYDDLIDSWFVDQFKFSFDTSYYKGAEKDENVVMVSDEGRRFWTTSHAKSFRCLLLHDVSLVDDNDKYSGTVHFNEARVQALTKSKTFKTPKHCVHRVHRNEMVPITVGVSLCILTLLTVGGYAAFRYFKVKKFQYGGME